MWLTMGARVGQGPIALALAPAPTDQPRIIISNCGRLGYQHKRGSREDITSFFAPVGKKTKSREREVKKSMRELKSRRRIR